MVRARWLVLAALTSGCEATVTEIALDDLDFDYAFLLIADEQGAPERVVSAVGQPDGALPGASLRSGEARFYLITFTEAELRAAFPGFDDTRVDPLELRIAPPPGEPEYVDITDAINTRVRAALPDSARLFAGAARSGGALGLDALEPLTLAASQLRPALTLDVPVVDGYCRNPEQSLLQPFAATADAITQARGNLDVRKLTWVGEDRLLVLGSQELVVVERNQQLVGSSTRAEWKPWLQMREVVPAPRLREQLGAMVLDPVVEPDGRRRIWIAGGVAPDALDDTVPTPSWLRSAWLTAEGMAWSDAPPVDIPNFPRTLEFREDGALIVGAHLGKAFVRTSSSASSVVPLEPSPRNFVSEDDDFYWFRRTGHDNQTMIAASKAGLHVYDRSRGRWDSTELEHNRVLSAEPVKFFGLDSAVRASGALSIFASTQIGAVFWRLNRLAPWEQPELRYPPSFRPCSAAGELAYGRHAIHAIEAQGDYLFMAYALCSSMVVMPLPEAEGERPCLYLLHEQPEEEDGRAVARVVDSRNERVALATRPGAAAIASAHGSIYVSEW